MFLSACREVAKSFPNIRYDEDLLDRVCLQVRLLFRHAVLHSDALLDRTKPEAVRGSRDGYA
jgi:hypothetical protein